MSRNGPEKPTKTLNAAQRREQRRAETLRANLKRRKAVGPPREANTSGKPEAGEE
jgi:hypothetical protein